MRWLSLLVKNVNDNTMARIDEVRLLFDKLCNTNLTMDDDIPEISGEEKVKIVELINSAKAEAERLHILDIMNKVCK
jgi:hypothetical protein